MLWTVARRGPWLSLALSLAVAMAGCDDGGSGGQGGSGGSAGAGDGGAGGAGGSSALAIVPGQSVGPIGLDMTFMDVKKALGEPSIAIASSGVGFVRYDDLGLEVVVTSPSSSKVEDSAVVVAVGVSKAAGFSGAPLVGQARGQIEGALGAPADEVGPISYFAEGASVQWDDSDVAVRVAVTPAYKPATTPPEMTPAP